MKTEHMTIDEKKATITVTNINELTQAEWRIYDSYKSMGFKLRKKRQTAKNAMHKKGYYIEKLKDDIAGLAMFESICGDKCFATAVKWYRTEYITGRFAEEQEASPARTAEEIARVVEMPAKAA